MPRPWQVHATRFMLVERVSMATADTPGDFNAVLPIFIHSDVLTVMNCSVLQGVLRIHFLEALDLEGKDKFLGGLIKGKSDPYGVLQIGNQLFQSKTVKESLHPKWNEVYEVRG